MVSETLSHYRILRKLGEGGMGEVYLAQDTTLNRKVALKILPAVFGEDKDRMNRFVREAQSASALNHPNIITIYEIGQSEGTHFIAAEFIDGQTLHDYSKSNPLQLKTVLEIGIQIASALDEAHSAGIVHRDMKPDNVMVRPNGLVKILDFGIAKLSETRPVGVDEEAATALKPQSTSPGTIIGTANYMSPEQAKGKEVDARTDIFSFGVVLYEMIARGLPFEGETPIEMIGAILHKETKPLPAEVPTEIKRIIQKCLRKDRDERYQTIRDVLNDLKDVRQDLELQKKLERTVAPDREEPQTEILQATTVDETTRSSTNTTNTKSPAKKYLQITLAILLISALSYFGYRYFKTSSNQIQSIAVMPFVNDSGNADIEYLSDGMTETLISSLSQLPNLSVKARSSVFRYKGKDTDAKTIGNDLNVQAILNGRVVQRGDQLTLSLELVNVATENAIWSQQYVRKVSDLVTLQSEIARDVSVKLKSKLSGTDEARVTKAHTTNPEAYQLYLKGKFHYSKYGANSYLKAIEYYKQAIEIDPNYALPYIGIAAAYNWADDWYLPPNEAMPKAKAAALKALELDNNLADAHMVLGKIALWYDYDWVTAENEMKRAGELDSSYTIYPVFLSAMGRHDEAIKAQETTVRSLPLDLNMNMDLESIYLYAGRYDQAIAQCRKTLELDGNYWGSYANLGQAYERKKQYTEAIAALEKARTLDSNTSIIGYLGYVYAAAGRTAEAQKVLVDLKEISKQRHVSPYSFAVVYAGLNDKDQAFEWLDRAYEARSFAMALIKVDTVFDNLHSDPRFKELLKRINLPE